MHSKQGAYVNLLPSKKKGRSTARFGVVVAASAALIGMGLASPAGAAVKDDGIAQAEGSVATGTGIFDPVAQLLQTGTCKAVFTHGGPEKTTGQCTSSISTSPAQAITRFATAHVSGSGLATSAAEGGTASVPLTALPQNLDLTNLYASLAATPVAASALGPIIAQLTALLQPAANALLPLLDTALQPLITALANNLPLALEVGAVQAYCAADGDTASAASNIAGVSLNVTVPGVQVVKIKLDTPIESHSDLVMDSPGQLVDALLSGLATSLANPANIGILQPLLTALATVVNGVNDLITPIIAALRPTLLASLSQVLKPIVTGEVNHVTAPAHATHAAPSDVPFLPINGWSTKDEIGLTALTLTVLGTNTLTVGMVHCGDNVNASNFQPPAANQGLQMLKTEDIDGDDEVEWTLRVHNPLDHAVDNVFVKDFLPSEVKKSDLKVTEKSQGTFNHDTVVWTVGTLASGATATLKLKADVDEDDLQDGIDNAACVNKSQKPKHIQKNDSFKDDTDGCDTSNSESDDDSPKSINSGVAGSGGNLSAAGLAGLLALTAMGGSVARRRFNA